VVEARIDLPLARSSAVPDAATIAELSQGSVADRLAAIEQIWNSIVEEGQPLGVSEELGAELDRRRREHHADPQSAIPWSEIRDAV
jgi:putative addiction module component (TIGR02574 family)